MTEPMLLSLSEASERIGIGEQTVRELVRSGQIASVPIGKRNRKVTVEALQEYIRKVTTRGVE